MYKINTKINEFCRNTKEEILLDVQAAQWTMIYTVKLQNGKNQHDVFNIF